MKAEIGNLDLSFKGYPPATSNYTCTPNQFFEVVLPYSSRGVVRIVGYMIRQILGWSDAAGNPKRPQLEFTYNELITNAGVSRPMIKPALAEALSAKFIKCIREPKSASAGLSPVSGLYELNFDHSGNYVDNLEAFNGFYTGEGRFTPTPNTYFDFTILEETLAVSKLVGIIIRNTVGFQNHYGLRRTEVALSYLELQKKTQLGSAQLAEAMKAALERGHIVRISEGSFSRYPSNGKKASYGINWTDKNEEISGGKKSEASIATPEIQRRLENRSESGKKGEVIAVRNPKQERSENRSTIKKVQIQEKQQQKDVVVSLGLVSKLVELGFSENGAKDLITKNGESIVLMQLSHLPSTQSLKNPAGFLRNAVEKQFHFPKPIQRKELMPVAVAENRILNVSKLIEVKTRRPEIWVEFLRLDELLKQKLSASQLISKETKEKLIADFKLERNQVLRFGEYLIREKRSVFVAPAS